MTVKPLGCWSSIYKIGGALPSATRDVHSRQSQEQREDRAEVIGGRRAFK